MCFTHLAKYFAALEVVVVGDDDTFDGVDMVAVINEVALTQIDGQFSVRGCFLEDFHGRDHFDGWLGKTWTS